MEGLKKSFLVRGNNIVGFSDKNFSTCPIGTVLSFAGQTAPHGYLLCDGASYKVADYPDLYAVIGNTYGGDTENFNVPNLVDKFIQGSTISGTEKEAGLPNITGGFYSYSYFNGTPSGAITTSVENRNQTQSGGDNMRTYIHYLLDASKSNSIYGKSTTVQPPALTMVYIIKAFHTNEGVDSGVSNDVINYVNDSLVDKQDFRIFKSLEEFNEKKGTSFTVVSGVDNMVDIANAMSEGDMLIITIKYNTGSEIYFGLDSSTGWTKIFTFIKANGLCDVECRTTLPSTFKRVLNVDGIIGTWQELATIDKVESKYEEATLATPVDWNTLNTKARYYVSGGAIMTNAPMQQPFGELVVETAGDGSACRVQKFFSFDGRLYMRRWTGSVWNEWYKFDGTAN